MCDVLLHNALFPSPFGDIFFLASRKYLLAHNLWRRTRWAEKYCPWFCSKYYYTARLQSWRHPTNRRALAYRLYPLFAGFPLILSGIISFGNPVSKSVLTATVSSSQQQLMGANLVLTSILSATQCMQLKNGMLGTESNRTWIRAQAQLSITFSLLALVFSSSVLGQMMKHLHYSLLLTAGGALERLYVLWIVSQVRAQDKKSFSEILFTSASNSRIGLNSFGFGDISLAFFIRC